MVAYSFKKRFIEPIHAGTKRQTMRAERKRHARAGEEMQLYYGMRTKHCMLIARAPCLKVTPVRIDFRSPCVEIAGSCDVNGARALNEFAVYDGFATWDELVDFWAVEHPEAFERRSWSGVIIYWGGLIT